MAAGNTGRVTKGTPRRGLRLVRCVCCMLCSTCALECIFTVSCCCVGDNADNLVSARSIAFKNRFDEHQRDAELEATALQRFLGRMQTLQSSTAQTVDLSFMVEAGRTLKHNRSVLGRCIALESSMSGGGFARCPVVLFPRQHCARACSVDDRPFRSQALKRNACGRWCCIWTLQRMRCLKFAPK